MTSSNARPWLSGLSSLPLPLSFSLTLSAYPPKFALHAALDPPAEGVPWYYRHYSSFTLLSPSLFPSFSLLLSSVPSRFHRLNIPELKTYGLRIKSSEDLISLEVGVTPWI